MSWPRRSWLGPVRTASGGMRRHKVQAIAIGLVVLVSTASATLGLALLAASNAPFTHAFGTQNGAHVTVTVNAARASTTELAATRHLGGVTAAAGPFSESVVQTQFQGQPFGQLALAGRASAGGPVDDVVLNAGHWPDGPGQVVLDGSAGGGGPALGSTITVTGVPGTPALVVVGFGNSVTNTADGWVTPGEITRLRAPGVPQSAQMLYRFTHAASYGEVRADVAEVSRALPPGAVTGAASWLAAQNQATGNGAIMEPFVVAFALIGLAMAVLIVGNVVSGAVVASYTRIGVLKSIGLTPAQVVVAYLSRVGWPALAGCLAGVVAGNVLAAPVLQESARRVRRGQPAGAVVGLGRRPGRDVRAGAAGRVRAGAARGPAVRRGGDRGRPRPAGGSRVRRPPARRPAAPAEAGRPRAGGAVRPARADRGDAGRDRVRGHRGDLRVRAELLAEPGRGQPDPLRHDPGAGRAVRPGRRAGADAHRGAGRGGGGRAARPAGHAARGDAVRERGQGARHRRHRQRPAFDGDASWTGYGIIAGRWYDAPGEVDVNTAFLDQSGLAVGDTATVNTGTAQVTVRIAGEVFDPDSQARMYGSTQTLPGVASPANVQEYDVALRPGVSADAYVQAVNGALGGQNPWQATTQQDGGQFYTIASDLVGLLAIMVAVAAGLGVLNTVLMTTRDRVHDLGVFKALGMRPGQVLTMVVCWIAGPAVVAAAIAAPAAVALNTATVHAMAGTAHTGIPASFTQVFPPSRLALLSLAAVAIAVAGALLPAGWAARARPPWPCVRSEP